MAHIKIKRGLDIPIEGKPEGPVHPLVPGGEVSAMTTPQQLYLDLKPFEEVKFRLLVKVGDAVKIGQPLAEDKSFPGRMFVSPAGGIVKEVRRGLKRRLLGILIEVIKNEGFFERKPLTPQAPREEVIAYLSEAGIFARIRRRPFNELADPQKVPRAIFVKAIESAPFVPPAELQVQGNEKEFQQGLDILSLLAPGATHIVYHMNSTCHAFTEAQHVHKHTAEGPHPVANVSVHLEAINPIDSPEDNIWTLNARDVVAIGHLVSTGHYYTEKVISIAGPGVLPGKRGYFRIREGYPIRHLLAGRTMKGDNRLISGDPLMGNKVEPNEYLGFFHDVFCIIPENHHREFLHFFRLGTDKYSFSKAYLTGHLDNHNREYYFTTNQHGEERAFIDSSLYYKVQPLAVPTMELVKAVMAEDFELAASLGLIDVDSEDFALPTFVCPSKIEMTEIIKIGLKRYAKEIEQ